MDSFYRRLQSKGKPLAYFTKGTHVKAPNGYTYVLSENPGENMAFEPDLTPGEILALGAFEGKYLNDSIEEFPVEWFLNAAALGKLRPNPLKADERINCFGVKSRMPLSEWRKKGWVAGSGKNAIGRSVLHERNPDERGWFHWYSRYWMGRRSQELDETQIKRYRLFARHIGQIKKNCNPGDVSCRPRQRQGILQWAHNPFL